MANITMFFGTRNGVGITQLAQFYGAQTPTEFEVINSDGILIELNRGKNFTYGSNGFFQTGTVKETYYFRPDGQLSYQATNLIVDVETRNDLLSIGESSYDFRQYELRGNDTIRGSEENDKLVGSKGADRFDGRGGVDVLSFNGFGQAVTVNLSTGRATTSSGVSTLINVEDVEGSAFADRLIGNGSANLLQGFAGADLLDGKGGLDTVSYLDGVAAVTVDLAAGTASGGSGTDDLVSVERVIGSRFGDTLLGSGAADIFLGSFGDDLIDGRGGVDTAEYQLVGRPVDVNLATGLASGGAGNDELISIENLLGSIFGDKLTGNGVANRLDGAGGADVLGGGDGADLLLGGEGDDRLTGGVGADKLVGGSGADRLTGGAGPDIFLFSAALGGDRILDFDPARDMIQLDDAIFPGLARGALAAGAFRVGTKALDAGDRIIYNSDTGALLFDPDGTGAQAARSIATLGSDLPVTSADFIVV